MLIDKFKVFEWISGRQQNLTVCSSSIRVFQWANNLSYWPRLPKKWAENRCFWPTGKPRDRALHGVKLTDHWPTTPIDGKTLAFSDFTASKFLSRTPSASQNREPLRGFGSMLTI